MRVEGTLSGFGSRGKYDLLLSNPQPCSRKRDGTFRIYGAHLRGCEWCRLNRPIPFRVVVFEPVPADLCGSCGAQLAVRGDS
jgi:hypothetical protein